MKTVKKCKSKPGRCFRLNLTISAVLLTALILSGCQTDQTTSQGTDQAENDGPKAVTFFGTTIASRQQHLVFPIDTSFIEWISLDGQRLAPDDSVFVIDRTQWVRHYDQQRIQLRVITENLAVLQSRIDQLGEQIEQWQAAGFVDLEDGLTILEKLVRTTSRTRRNTYESELYTFLSSIQGLSMHQSLVNLTDDAAQTKNLARPILAQWVADLKVAADEAELQQKSLRQQILAGKAELAEISGQLAQLDGWLSGKVQQNLGYLDQKGHFIYTGTTCLLERSTVQDGASLVPGQVVARFTCLPINLVSVPVDEQLIPLVAIGATVQLSPVYDRTLVWIGHVTFMSEKAVIINDETVIPVLVSTDESLPGPGYTVIAKILPVVP